MTAFEMAAFDMAGTTVDEDGLVYAVLDSTITEAIGAPVPHDVLDAWKGTGKREAIAGILAAVGADDSPAMVDAHFATFQAALIDAYRDTPPTPFAGVLDTFADLRGRGIKVALQTGYSADVAREILGAMGWTVGTADATVDALVTSDMVPASRPAPYLVFRCMEQLGVHDVRRVITAGDTPNDVWAGHHAGAGMVVAVLTGSFDAAGLVDTPHTHLLDSVAAIPDQL